MLTIISFLVMLIGGVNWLLIGLLQYDFVAGIFGYQGSIFSRIIYIIIGLASAFFVFKVIKGKGSVAIFSRRNKKDIAKNIAKMQNKSSDSPATANVEASQDFAEPEKPKEEGLLNEHFKDE